MSPQTIPAAYKMVFLRHEVLLQAGINALHVLSSWELHWSVPQHCTPHLSGCVKLLQFSYLTRKQLKLWIFMIAFRMSWQWVSSSLSRSAIYPEPFFCSLKVFTLHQMLSGCIRGPTKTSSDIVHRKDLAFYLWWKSFLLGWEKPQLFLLFSFNRSMKFSKFAECSWHESSTAPAR